MHLTITFDIVLQQQRRKVVKQRLCLVSVAADLAVDAETTEATDT